MFKTFITYENIFLKQALTRLNGEIQPQYNTYSVYESDTRTSNFLVFGEYLTSCTVSSPTTAYQKQNYVLHHAATTSLRTYCAIDK